MSLQENAKKRSKSIHVILLVRIEYKISRSHIYIIINLSVSNLFGHPLEEEDGSVQ